MRPFSVAAWSSCVLISLAARADAGEAVFDPATGTYVQPAPEPTPYEEEFEDEDLGVYVALDAELFGGGTYARTDDGRMTRFDIERAEVGTRLEYGDTVSAELRLETVRPVPSPEVPGAELEGDDSLTVRAKRAWGAWHETRKRKRPSFEVRGGLIPEPWIEAVESGYELRALAPTAAEHAHLIEHADLGLAALMTFKMLRLQVAVTNGEGTTRPELNRDKNVAAILSMRMPRLPGDTIVTAHFYGRGGTTGVDRARSHRVGTALTIDSPRYGGGAEMVSGWGVGEVDDINAVTGGIWAYATLKGRNGLAGRVDWTRTIEGMDDVGRQRTATIALWRDLIPRGASRVRDFGVRGYLAAQFDRVSSMPEMAGSPAPVDATRFMVILQASARETVE